MYSRNKKDFLRIRETGFAERHRRVKQWGGAEKKYIRHTLTLALCSLKKEREHNEIMPISCVLSERKNNEKRVLDVIWA